MADFYEAPPITQMSTPASGVANALQEIVSRRAFEKRQALMDELDRRQKEAQIEVARQNAESLAEYRKAQAEERAARARAGQEATDLRKLKTFIPGEVSDPGSIEWLKEKFPQTLRTSEAGFLSGDEQGPVQGKTEFLGDPAYQQQQKEQQALLGLEGNEEFKNASPLGKFLMMRSVVSDAKDLGNIAPLMKQEQPVRRVVMDARGRVVLDKEFPSGTTFDTLPQPPQGPQPQFIGTDPDTGTPVFHQGGAPFIMGESGKRQPFTGKLGAKPSAAGANKLFVIPPADEKAIADAYKAAERSKSSLLSNLGITSPPKGDPQALGTLYTRQVNAAYKLTGNPQIREAVSHSLSDPDAPGMTSNDLADLYAQQGAIPNTDQAKQEFVNVLNAVRQPAR